MTGGTRLPAPASPPTTTDPYFAAPMLVDEAFVDVLTPKWLELLVVSTDCLLETMDVFALYPSHAVAFRRNPL